MSISKTKYTTQYIKNMSFDDEYKKEAVTLLTENTAGTSLTTQKKIATEDKQDDLITILSNSIDDTTQNIITIDTVHREVHEGDHYTMQGYLELNNGDTYNVKLVTPDTAKWVHFVFDIKSTGICTTHFDEDAVGGMEGGSAIIPQNSNRNSSKTSGLVITGGVTSCTEYSTRLENDKWGTGGFKETIGGASSRENEIILKQNTTYCRSFISGASDNIIQFEASWYEHQNN